MAYTATLGGSGWTVDPIPAGGAGVPAGGATNEVLGKVSATDGDVSWRAGGAGDMVLASSQTITGAKTYGSAGAVGRLKVAGTTSGAVTLDAPAVAGAGTVSLPATGTLATLAGTESFSSKTYVAPTLSGISTSDGASVTTANAMGALSINTIKGLNTKSIAVDSTFTFSGTPSALDTWFALHLTNTDTAPHIVTMPTAFSQVTQANRTTFPIAASGQVYLTWRSITGGAYVVFGDSPFFNKYDATVAPTVNDDVADGYGAGSLWLNATANALYICESAAAGAAVWNSLGGSSGSVATDTIWDAAGDLVYGTGADTAARLVKGTAGQVLTMNAGATAPEWATSSGSVDQFMRLKSRFGVSKPAGDNQAVWTSVGTTIATWDTSTLAVPAVNDDALGRLSPLQYTVAGGANIINRGAGWTSNQGAVLDVSSTGTELFPLAFTFAITDATPTDGCAFVGFWSGGTLNVEPTNFTQVLGFGLDVADANWGVFHNDSAGVCTRTDLGASFVRATRTPYLFVIDRPSSGTTNFELYAVNLATGAVSSTVTVSANKPDADRFVVGAHRWSMAVAITAQMQSSGWQKGKAF